MHEDRDRRTWPLTFEEGAGLIFGASHAAVELLPVEAGGQPRIEVSGHAAGRLSMDIDTDGDDVRVEVGQQGWHLMFGRGDARVTLYLPRGLRVEARTDVGSIHARDLGPSDLALRADAGSITAENLQGRLRLTADAGKISGRGLRGSFDVRSDAGSIRLGIDALDPGEHRFRSSAGSIRLWLAPGLDVRIEAHANLGSTRVSYPSRVDAPAVLRASAEVGSVRIREAGDDEGEEREEARVRVRTRGFGRGWDMPIPPIPPAPPFDLDLDIDLDDIEVEFESDAPHQAAPSSPATGSAARTQRPVDPEVERILKMVESGELSAQDADELLRALNRE